MPCWFEQFVQKRPCPGLIVVREEMSIRNAIEDLFIIWHVSETEELGQPDAAAAALTRDSLAPP